MIEIRKMSLNDLQLVLGWAADEGWNPGRDDAEAFYKVDPDGYLMGWLGDVPVSAISAVRNGYDYSFIGLYLCHPDHRGKGYGWDIWQAAIMHLGQRTIGLDGVPDQQDNYRKSGFELSHNTARYGGVIKGERSDDFIFATPDMMPDLIAFDAALSGIKRGQYVSVWFGNAASRKTLVGKTGDKITSIGTIRECGEGHKIGPLYAQTIDEALDLLKNLVHEVSAETVFVDVPQINTDSIALMTSLGLLPSFETARMYKGRKPVQVDGQIFGVVTLELG